MDNQNIDLELIRYEIDMLMTELGDLENITLGLADRIEHLQSLTRPVEQNHESRKENSGGNLE